MYKKAINEMRQWLLYSSDDKLYRAYVEKLKDEEVEFFYNAYFIFMDEHIKKFVNFIIKYKERY